MQYKNIESYKNKLERLKLLILDVDGILTDGTKVYDNAHKCIAKNFLDIDFTAIKIFKKLGVEVCLLSGDEWNSTMAAARGIPFFPSRNEDGSINKVNALKKILNYYNNKIKQDNCLYIGDDYFDIGLMEKLKVRIWPSDTPKYLLKNGDVILSSKRGEGVVAEILSDYLIMNNITIQGNSFNDLH